jgi:hypothetical protein
MRVYLSIPNHRFTVTVSLTFLEPVASISSLSFKRPSVGVDDVIPIRTQDDRCLATGLLDRLSVR